VFPVKKQTMKPVEEEKNQGFALLFGGQLGEMLSPLESLNAHECNVLRDLAWVFLMYRKVLRSRLWPSSFKVGV